MNNINAKQMKALIDAKLSHHYGLKPEDADNDHIYKALVLVIRVWARGESIVHITHCACLPSVQDRFTLFHDETVPGRKI